MVVLNSESSPGTTRRGDKSGEGVCVPALPLTGCGVLGQSPHLGQTCLHSNKIRDFRGRWGVNDTLVLEYSSLETRHPVDMTVKH